MLTITVREAAERLDFPVATTERIARDLGLLIMAGNRKRIDPNDLPEIMDACRSTPRDRASTGTQRPGSTSSATQVGGTAQQALEIAARLKKPSVTTSPQGTGQLVPLQQRG